MAWTFDHEIFINQLIETLDDMVGDQLSFLLDPVTGIPTTLRSIVPDLQGAPQPPLPFIEVRYEGSNDNAGFLLDQGLVEVEDPEDPPNLIWAPYWDKYTQFGVTIRCEGLRSQQILQDVRRKFLLERFRSQLRGTDPTTTYKVFSSIELINSIQRTPDLLDTEYRDVGSFLLKLNTVDRLIDIETGCFDTINYESNYKKGINDPNTLTSSGSVTSK